MSDWQENVVKPQTPRQMREGIARMQAKNKAHHYDLDHPKNNYTDYYKKAVRASRKPENQIVKEGFQRYQFSYSYAGDDEVPDVWLRDGGRGYIKKKTRID